MKFFLYNLSIIKDTVCQMYIFRYRQRIIKKAKTYDNFSTSKSLVNLCLSSGGLPLDPGYSQSMSRPSKPYFRKNVTDVVAKCCERAKIEQVKSTHRVSRTELVAVHGYARFLQDMIALNFDVGLVCYAPPS